MQYTSLGRTGLRVSRLCLGTGAFGVAPLEADAVSLVHQAIDVGVNFFDTANSYGNFRRVDRPGAPPHDQRASAEEILGRALKGRRDGVVVATKVREPVGPGVNDGGLSRRHIMQQVDRSLSRLQTDYIDLYHMHGPDFATPLEETMRALDDLVRQGKIRYAGFSNYTAWRMAAAIGVCEKVDLVAPVVHQVRYNLLQRDPENDVLAACEHFGVGVTAWSPLCMGLLSGTDVLRRPVFGMQRYVVDKSALIPFSENEVAATEKLETLAREWGPSPAQLALAWLGGRPNVASAIIGPESTAELDAATPAGDLQLSDAQRSELDDLLPPPPSPEALYQRAVDALSEQAR
ncbi:MAG: 1-deoxyxylulose-5-phosphate synthase [Frankiaceae bacterium]|nr:1-deoxyxylulose-5-phosphate synthase [Frankiaceae bacterium]